MALTLTGTLESFINSFSYAGPRFGFLLMSIFGGVGLILVTVGVYSVLAYTAAQGRMRSGFAWRLGRRAGTFEVGCVDGSSAGGAGRGDWSGGEFVAGGSDQSQFWGVSAYDPMTLIGVTALLLLTGLVACWIPARRASRVDPLVALRYE